MIKCKKCEKVLLIIEKVNAPISGMATLFIFLLQRPFSYSDTNFVFLVRAGVKLGAPNSISMVAV